MVECKGCKKKKDCTVPCIHVERYADQDYVARYEHPSHSNLFEYSTREYLPSIDEARQKKDEDRDLYVDAIREIDNSKLRAVLSLKFFGFSYYQIAELLSTPRTTIMLWVKKFSK